MRRVLVVAYFFPPVGGVGIERTLKHVTYLPEHGWQPVVVTVSGSGYRIVEPASERRVPAGVEVYRSGTAEPAHLRRALGRLVSHGPVRGGAPAAARSDGRVAARGGSLRAMANRAWGRLMPLLFFPDDQVIWGRGAARLGLRVHAAEAVDAIYSSSPPISGHLAAERIAGRAGLPWIADFRDPWIGNSFARPLNPLHRAIQRRLERRIVEGADRVVVATAGMREQFAARYPGQSGRIIHVPNGYDPLDLQVPAAERAADGTYRLTYAGSMYGEDELTVFLDGLQLLLGRQPAVRDRLRVEFVGWFSAATQAISVRRFPALEPVVRQVGFVDRERAIALQRASDAGLVIISGTGNRGVVATSKIYEYLGLDLPVLAIVPPGEVRQILGGLDWGVVADPTPEGVANGLERIMEVRRPTSAADPERHYERRNLSAELARLLEEVTEEAAAKRN
ncbi:MAG: glycosyltransferase [Chloroflexota bacterium]